MSAFFKPSNPVHPEMLATANTAYDQGKCPACGAIQSMHFMPGDVMSCGMCVTSFRCDAMDPRAAITECLGVLKNDQNLHRRYLNGDRSDKLMDPINRAQAAARGEPV